MTKTEELNVLKQINELIVSAGSDSYIGMTFAGVVEMCRENIVSDFGNCPVADLEDMRRRFEGAVRDCKGMSQSVETLNAENKRLTTKINEMKDMIDVAEGKAAMEGDRAESAIKLLEEERAASRVLRQQVAELTDARDTMTECVDGNVEIIDKLEMEVMRLKAEIYDLRKECER